MSDSTPATAEPTVKAPVVEPAQEIDWKAEARKWEQRAKENSAAAKRLADIEEANKTAEQKAAERQAELEAKVKAYELRDQIAGWAKEIVKGSSIPAEALRGSTEEELREHFEQLKALIPTQPEVTPFIVKGAGKTPGEPEEVSLDDQIVAAEKKGDFKAATELKMLKLAELSKAAR